VVLSGRVYSKLSSFKGKDLSFQIGEQTELITDFSLNGLPDYNELFMYVDFKKLTTYAKDFEIINKFLKNNKKISIPESFDKLGIINYKGNFAGFYDAFVTYGKFKTYRGNFSSYIYLRPQNYYTPAFCWDLVSSYFHCSVFFSSTDNI